LRHRRIYRWRNAIGRWHKSVDSAQHIDYIHCRPHMFLRVGRFREIAISAEWRFNRTLLISIQDSCIDINSVRLNRHSAEIAISRKRPTRSEQKSSPSSVCNESENDYH